MPPLARLAKIAASAVGFLTYVWFAAVRFAPQVKRRKEARHAARVARLRR
jgi:hypothetical protein